MARRGATEGVTEAGSPAVLRRLNLARVLRVIRDEGPLPRSGVVRSSRLSKPTVNEVVDALLADGLIVESLPGEKVSPRRPGPKARLLRFNSRRSFVVGVDLGAAKTLALLCDLDGNVLATVRRRTPRNGDVVRIVRQVIDEATSQLGLGRGGVAVVVVGAPGVVDPDSGVVRFVPQFPNLHGQPLREILTESLGTPVLLQSEAHLAVAGEHWRGVAREVHNAVYVQLGVGVGMGILIDGEVYRGPAGAAGEIGYLPLDGRQSQEGATDFGPFEMAVGAGAFNRLGTKAVAAGEGAAILAAAHGDEPGPAAVLEAAAAEDPAASQILDGILDTLIRGLISVSAILNPEMVVLGGGLAVSLQQYVDQIRSALAGSVPVPPEVRVTSLADQAVAIGAVRLGVEHVEAEAFAGLGARSIAG